MKNSYSHAVNALIATFLQDSIMYLLWDILFMSFVLIMIMKFLCMLMLC